MGEPRDPVGLGALIRHQVDVGDVQDAQRSIFYSEMKSAGFETIPSHANFVMVNIRKDVGPVIEEFWKRKILVGREN